MVRHLQSVRQLTSLQKRCQATKAVQRSASCLFPDEPKHPQVLTELPGPNAVKFTKRLSNIQNTIQTNIVADFHKSIGNYLVDVDGNKFLDSLMQIASIPVGYNNPRLADAVRSQTNIIASINRPALGSFPSNDYIEQLHGTLMSISPKGLNTVQTMMCGSCSNENAVKQVFIWHMRKQRKNAAFTDEQLQSCMINQPPGCPKLAILSFSGGFHGRTLGCLSMTHSKAIHKIDIPNFDWPMAPFPKLKYPIDENHEYNQKEEERCLNEVRRLVNKWRDEKECPVAGVIVEPIQAEGGDHHATPYFFNGLQKICKEDGMALIVDEVQTGLATGRIWAHEAWNLPEPPDIVTFSKKFLTGGYFYRDELRCTEGYRIYNTWMGDITKMILLDAALMEIKEKQLLKLSKESGNRLASGLRALQDRYPDLIHNARGEAGFQAFDCYSANHRDKLALAAKKRGLICSGSGDVAIRFRPSLVFEAHHVDIALDILGQVLKNDL